MDDGNVYKGKFTMFAVGLKGVNLRLKTESGDKIKGNRDNMNLIKFDAPKTKVGKLLSMANQGNKISLSETLGQDWKTALNQEYYIFRRVQNKKGKPHSSNLLTLGLTIRFKFILIQKQKKQEVQH